MDRRELLQMIATGVGAAALGAGQWWRRLTYLRDVSAGRVAYLRPPGAVEESEFLRRCIRCNQCADACENNCIEFVSGSAADGTPVIRPRSQGCILCMKCNHACPTGALRPVGTGAEEILAGVRMGTAVVDRNICNSYNGMVCGVCIRACPFVGRALKTGLWERPIVDEKYCVGCGLCENRCIVYPQAIRVRPASVPAPEQEAGR